MPATWALAGGADRPGRRPRARNGVNETMLTMSKGDRDPFEIRALPADSALRARARKVIPGGMWGHMSAERLPSAFPQYFSAARGTRVIDVDGNSYIDFMCAYGPMILGYRNPEVEAAVAEQTGRVDLANGPGTALVELAELSPAITRFQKMLFLAA